MVRQAKQALTVLCALLALSAAFAGEATQNKKKTQKTKKDKKSKVITTKSGLMYEDLKVGEGKEAKSGDNVSVHYTGTLKDGKQFDSSRGKSPFGFKLGAGMVIKGWDEGVAGMKIGGRRKLTIPANLAYGDRGFPGAIPPGAELTFDVELLGVK